MCAVLEDGVVNQPGASEQSRMMKACYMLINSIWEFSEVIIHANCTRYATQQTSGWLICKQTCVDEIKDKYEVFQKSPRGFKFNNFFVL